MLETNRATPDIDHQLQLLRTTARQVLSHPPVLLYPFVKSLLAVFAVLGIGTLLLSPVDGLGLDLAISVPVGIALVGVSVLVLYVVGPVLGVAIDVAYCYELHRLLDGDRPVPGSGLAVAVRQLPGITVGALAVSASFLAGYLADIGSLRVGSGVLDLFLAPALAIDGTSFSDIYSRIDEVTTKQWGTAALTVYGVGTLGRVAGILGIGGGVAIVVGQVVGAVPVTLPTALVLGVAVFLGGLGLLTFLQTLVVGCISTMLYHHAMATDNSIDVSKLLSVD